MIRHRILNLSLTPTELTYEGIIDPLCAISIQNIMDSGYAYIGDKNVSTANFGHKLYPGQSFSAEVAPADKLYAVSDEEVSVAIFTLDI